MKLFESPDSAQTINLSTIHTAVVTGFIVTHTLQVNTTTEVPLGKPGSVPDILIQEMSMEIGVSTGRAGHHYEARVDVLLPPVWSESIHLYPELSLRDKSQKVR
jgi:hypothetical protein